jgi:hypothetical protein
MGCGAGLKLASKTSSAAAGTGSKPPGPTQPGPNGSGSSWRWRPSGWSASVVRLTPPFRPALWPLCFQTAQPFILGLVVAPVLSVVSPEASLSSWPLSFAPIPVLLVAFIPSPGSNTAFGGYFMKYLPLKGGGGVRAATTHTLQALRRQGQAKSYRARLTAPG